VLGITVALGGVPQICRPGGWQAEHARAPQEVNDYLRSLAQSPFDLRAACARWAHRTSRGHPAGATGSIPPARMILFPARDLGIRQLTVWLSHSSQVRRVERAQDFVVAEFAENVSNARLLEILDAQQVEYFEPDCDGPDFLTTSNGPLTAFDGGDCWRHKARATFPNDPCMDQLWGHQKIGWDSSVAARSLPRLVAVLDSGIDARHADLARNVVLNLDSRASPRSLGRNLNSRCATSGLCFPHGTEMAGTIGGRMDNGIGVVGVAPNSRLVPIVISQVDRGLLSRLSTIAVGIEAAAHANVDVINISAKWPVDSRAISTAILRAVDADALGKRLIVTGYTATLERDDTVREYYPSRYRCLPGVVAAVPTDMRGRELFNPRGMPDATDGRIQAPGVDIVVTTTENSEQGYALSEAAGPSSAAAYVSGAVALVWGSPPLDQCGAQEIKQLLFCRSKSSESSRYPWINVDFLRELDRIDAGADCRTAMESLGCN
jgi:hypothetical protein